ncbi:MAG TPA: aminotransferase class IV [Flavobacteriaceae bacterium]|nr:aminotransferase class IV [Flavobacteriaceae bacterium]
MINFNGTLSENKQLLSTDNRGFTYGDALFETLKVVHGKVLFWEDHYFRLMASLRILRMEIPMYFTMEFLEEEVLKTLAASGLSKETARVKLMVFRDSEGRYFPESNAVGYTIDAQVHDAPFYLFQETPYTIDLYKDFYVAPGLLSTLKTTNKVLHVTGSIYASENGFDNCLLLNTNKQVVEALNGNVFWVKGTTIKTPPLTDGCLKGIIRKQIIGILDSLKDTYEFEEASLSPFELQQADELFITNVMVGIQPVTRYRKKEYRTEVSKMLLAKLNAKARLG